MKTQPTKPLYFLLILGLIALSAGACKKRKAEKALYGSYSRDLPNETYTDSSTQLLLLSESFVFTNDGEFNLVLTTGVFGSEVAYTVEKSDDDSFDLELNFIGLNYSDWLPKNYQSIGGQLVNTVVPNQSVLDQVRFYVKTDDNSLQLLIRYPNGDILQEYVRN